ncbi:MAG: hypothetical protein Q8K72_15585, partial [Acidimicrobiales bacterium]|nr:hypothetical protein [Acidimicrobiales bacterium]
HLEALEADGGTDIVAAASHLLARPGPPGLTVLVSDLLTPTWEQAISRLPARGGDLVVVHILAEEEIAPVLIGDLDVVDSETGRSVSVSLSAASLAEYARLAETWSAGVALRCRRAGAAYVRLLDTDDLEERLLGSWRDAGVLR